MLLIGVDEAGYGPLLGPLVVGGAAFRLRADPDTSDESPDAAGARVRAAFAGPGRGPPRVAVDDSKRLYARGGLAALERPLLTLLRAAGRAPPSCLDDLLVDVGVDPGARRDSAWYAGGLPRFPLAHGPLAHGDDLEGEARELRSRLGAAGVALSGLAAEVVPEERLNALFGASGNKSDTLFELSCGVFERLAAAARPDEPVVVVFDRQGGRKRYGPPLQERYPDGFVWTRGESEQRSWYEVRRGARSFRIEYRVGADASAPQTALASMLAKYLRELHMTLWNAWFAELCPEVRPTAGYTEDGRRWLDETRAAREAAGIPDARLVRVR